MNEYQSLTSPSTPILHREEVPDCVRRSYLAKVGDGLRFPGEFVEAKSAA